MYLYLFQFQEGVCFSEYINGKGGIMNNLITSYDIVKKVVEKLFFCTTKDQVEEAFLESKIDDPAEKKFLLQRCMQVEESYGFPTKEKLSDNDEYEYELTIFLEGSWRLLIASMKI